MTWLHNLLLTLFSLPVKWLVKVNSIPTDIEKELGIDREKPIIYLLRTHSITDQLALKMSASKVGLPSPTKKIRVGNEDQHASVFLEQPKSLLGRGIKGTRVVSDFTHLFQLHRENQQLDLQIVPVTVFWGRAPGRKSSGLFDMLADKASPSWLRKFFIVLFLGRDNFVSYSKAVSSRSMTELPGSESEIAHKLIRLAGTHFHRKRQAFTGPTLLEKQDLYNAILGSSAVKNAINEEARQKKISVEKARIQAYKYINEIAADYREGLIRFGDRVLTRIWNKIYDGIDVTNADKVRQLAQKGHEIIYVPCHRSHMDYLLLTYVIYHEGLVTPHIAAGINLNFWPVGGIFRRGGAFFLRRSFAGNKLYTAVFREYLELLFNKGYSVKYYPEGGRSRTGRLLPPKTGMLAMTLQAMVKGVNRPVSIVPVYIGYEHVMEVGSYLKELKGTSKKKESVFGLFSVVRKLKNYGHGFLNFGEPIQLNNYLDKQVPNWRSAQGELPERKPSWLTPTVNHLANQIMTRINQSAAINGMSICALCLLSAKKNAMGKLELQQAVDDYLELLRLSPYSELVSLPDLDGKQIVENTLKLGKMVVTEDSFGKIISLEQRNAVTLTYYRNNILHLFAIPGLIAAILFARNGMEKTKLLDLIGRLYPMLQRELFLSRNAEEGKLYAESIINSMQQMGMIVIRGDELVPCEPTAKSFYSLWLLNRSIQETLQRYALVLSLLAREGKMSRGALERTSVQFAERLSALHGISSPEFFDKNVLATFVNALRENNLLADREDSQLQHSEASEQLRQDIIALIAPEIAQRLEKLYSQQH